MRHPRSFPLFRTCAMAFTILIGLLGMPASGFAQTATPEPASGIDGVTVTDLGTVVSPPADSEHKGRTLRLKRVDFEEGAVDPEEGHAHDGAFVLTVDTGGVCYTYINIDVDSDVQVKVTAKVAANGAVPAGCESTQTDCAAPDGCELLPGETVYLTTGSSLTQSDTAWHRYGNVDPDNVAVVYLAEVQPGIEAAPCGGTCH